MDCVWLTCKKSTRYHIRHKPAGGQAGARYSRHACSRRLLRMRGGTPTHLPTSRAARLMRARSRTLFETNLMNTI